MTKKGKSHPHKSDVENKNSESKENKPSGLLKYMSARTIVIIGILIGVATIAGILYQTYKFQLNIQAAMIDTNIMPMPGEGEATQVPMPSGDTVTIGGDTNTPTNAAAQISGEGGSFTQGGSGLTGEEGACAESEGSDTKAKQFCINCEEECQKKIFGIPQYFSEWLDPMCQLTCMATKAILNITNLVGQFLEGVPL